MHMGDVIRLADIELPPGVTATGDPESPVVTVLVLRGAAAEGGEQTEGEDTTEGAGADESAAGEAEASDDAGE
jgi:hypothetical protein